MEKETEELLRFMHSQPMATIATINHVTHKPEAALIAFAELDTLEIVFETFTGSRKYENLQHDLAVALVIGWDAKQHITLQYEGVARELDTAEVEHHRQIFLAKDTPCDETFLRHPKVRLFKVQPTWTRYSDYTGEKPRIIERTF